MDVVVAPLSCSNISLLSQKLSLQRVRENFVYREHGSLNTSLRLVKTVHDENEAVQDQSEFRVAHRVIRQPVSIRLGQSITSIRTSLIITYTFYYVANSVGSFLGTMAIILQKGFSRGEHNGIKNPLFGCSQHLVCSESQYVICIQH